MSKDKQIKSALEWIKGQPSLTFSAQDMENLQALAADYERIKGDYAAMERRLIGAGEASGQMQAALEASQRVASWAKSEWREAGKRLEQSAIDEAQREADVRALVEAVRKFRGENHGYGEVAANLEIAVAKVRAWLPEVK